MLFRSINGLNVIFTVNILNEGVHIPNVDCIIFLRKTASSIIYNQQLGRVIADYNEEPLVFDLVNNLSNLNNSYSMIFQTKSNELKIPIEKLTTKNGEKLKITTHQVDLIEKLSKMITLNRLTDSDKEYIRTYAKTKLLTDIAKEINHRYKDVWRYCKIYNIEFKSNIIQEDEKDYIREHYKNMTIKELSKNLGIKPHKVADFMRKENLKCYNPRIVITPDIVEYLSLNINKIPLNEISKYFNIKYSTLQEYCHNNKLKYISPLKSKKDKNKEIIEDLQRIGKEHNAKQLVEFINKKYNKEVSQDYIRTLCYRNNIIFKTENRTKFSKISEEDKEYIIKSYNNGISKLNISRELKFDKKMISEYIDELINTGILIKRERLYNNNKQNKAKDTEIQFIQNNYNKITQAEISKRLNRSISFVEKWIKALKEEGKLEGGK